MGHSGLQRCRNPLKSGQGFNILNDYNRGFYNKVAIPLNRVKVSINTEQAKILKEIVAIPLNRVKVSIGIKLL